MTSDQLATWISHVRKAAGLSQTALGEGLGVTKANVSAWETKKHDPSITQLLRIVEVTNQPAPTELLKKLALSDGQPTANGQPLSAIEQKLISAFRISDESGRNALLWIAEQILAAPSRRAIETADFAPAPRAVNPDIPALKDK